MHCKCVIKDLFGRYSFAEMIFRRTCIVTPRSFCNFYCIIDKNLSEIKYRKPQEKLKIVKRT